VIDRIGGLEGADVRRYPQTWLLLDVVDSRPRLLGQEIVDLSPGAIELRQAARELGAASENRDHWVPVSARSPVEGLDDAHRRRLSFGIDVSLCVELDGRREIHDGRPFRHLRLRRAAGSLTPATSAEVGLYFYGRRPATFGFVRADTAHGFVGFEWEGLAEDDVAWLLERELGAP
jgi:hypothetical protein